MYVQHAVEGDIVTELDGKPAEEIDQLSGAGILFLQKVEIQAARQGLFGEQVELRRLESAGF